MSRNFYISYSIKSLSLFNILLNLLLLSLLALPLQAQDPPTDMPMETRSATPTITETPSQTPTFTETPTETPTTTPSETATATHTETLTETPTTLVLETATETQTAIPALTASPTNADGLPLPPELYPTPLPTAMEALAASQGFSALSSGNFLFATASTVQQLRDAIPDTCDPNITVVIRMVSGTYTITAPEPGTYTGFLIRAQCNIVIIGLESYNLAIHPNTPTFLTSAR
jgi:cytoskeletal protein RodZ